MWPSILAVMAAKPFNNTCLQENTLILLTFQLPSSSIHFLYFLSKVLVNQDLSSFLKPLLMKLPFFLGKMCSHFKYFPFLEFPFTRKSLFLILPKYFVFSHFILPELTKLRIEHPVMIRKEIMKEGLYFFVEIFSENLKILD